jgi:hypothetical protein
MTRCASSRRWCGWPTAPTCSARHEHVAAGLLDWKAFSSASRPWHDPTSPRPEILLTDDPPRHTQTRKVIADALSPRALERVKGIFEARAKELLARLRERDTVDAVSDVSQAYVFQVLPDILGLPEQGREHMHGFSEMVWATMGPPGELFDQAMQHDYSAVIEWLETQCERGALDPAGIGETIYAASDSGQVTLAEAKLLLQTVLSAGARHDLHHHGQRLACLGRVSPPNTQNYVTSRRRSAPRSTSRCAGIVPSRMAGRITTREVEIDDYVDPGRHPLRADVRRRQPRSAVLGRARRLPLRPRQQALARLGLRHPRLRRPHARADGSERACSARSSRRSRASSSPGRTSRG